MIVVYNFGVRAREVLTSIVRRAMSREFQPATKPTMYFIGVATAQSSINDVFPRWAERLQLGVCELRGMDFPLRDNAEHYREAVRFIKQDRLSRGALVTSHKIDLCRACTDQFDAIDPLTRSLGEIGIIFKRNGQLHGRAVDPWTSGYALRAFLRADHWREGAEALILGAGGAGTALAWRLSKREHGANRPGRIHVTDRNPERLDHLRQLHHAWPDATPLELHHAADQAVATKLLQRLPAGSLVANATGMGKDTPGSPLSPDAVFPERGVAWEFNYRGALDFLQQARAQQHARKLIVEDGWTYFLHGWTRGIADVFEREIPTEGPLFDELGRIAAAARR
jgi:shikimate 5-dehydrogenase